MMNSLIIWLIVGLIVGFLAGKVVRGRGMGVAMDIVVGLVGAVLGGYLAGTSGIGLGGFLGEIVVAFAGAVILLFMVRLVTSRGRFGLR